MRSLYLCHMQYRWFRPNVREQSVVRKEQRKLNAYMAVEDGTGCVSLVGQVMDQGGCNCQLSNMPNTLPTSKEEGFILTPS